MKIFFKALLLISIGTIFSLPYLLYKIGKTVVFKTNSKNRGSKVLDFFADFLSGNWCLGFLPNGGTAVILRTLWTGSLFCFLAYVLYLITNHSLELNTIADIVTAIEANFMIVLKKNIVKCAGIYGAVYVTLYSRFVSQWTYIANLYNQIKQIEISKCSECESALTCNSSAEKECKNCECNHRIAEWKAGFIEDAITLHMYKKKLFATVIYQWLTEPNIQDEYVAHHSDTIFQNKGKTEEHISQIRSNLEKILSS